MNDFSRKAKKAVIYVATGILGLHDEKPDFWENLKDTFVWYGVGGLLAVGVILLIWLANVVWVMVFGGHSWLY